MSCGIDLHLHSNRSDGTLTPSELIHMCADAELTTVALTDHDTIDGIEEALAVGAARGIEVIPGVEISAGNRPEIHLLGYYPNLQDDRTIDWFCDLRANRALRTARMVARLRELGLRITLDDVQQQADERAGLGRPHVARALVQNGEAADIADAFTRYLAPGRPGYVSRNNPPPSEVLARMRALGMVPVLAHGALIDGPLTYIADLIAYMVKCGLRGLECYHSAYDRTMERFMIAQADRQGLLATGGSDYHGQNRVDVLPGDGVENWGDAAESLAMLKAEKERCRAGQR